jgi:hypothetical protein
MWVGYSLQRLVLMIIWQSWEVLENLCLMRVILDFEAYLRSSNQIRVGPSAPKKHLSTFQISHFTAPSKYSCSVESDHTKRLFQLLLPSIRPPLRQIFAISTLIRIREATFISTMSALDNTCVYFQPPCILGRLTDVAQFWCILDWGRNFCHVSTHICSMILSL